MRFSLLLLGFVLVVVAYTHAIEEYVQVELVDLYLTATDGKGHFVGNLRADELEVRENGVVQKIERFGPFVGERNELPILLAVVIDNSASMDSNIGDVRKIDLSQQAALLLIKQLGPLDSVMLVRFSDVPLITPITRDREEITKLLEEIRPVWNQTALFDSLASVIEELNRHPGRKILFLCSDGQDNISKTKFERVLELATNASDLTVVVLGAGATDTVRGFHGPAKKLPNVPYLRGKEYLENLAKETAGYAYFPENSKDVVKILDLVDSFIRSQYYLAYRPSNHVQDGSWRRIEITTKRKGVTLHYRRGYYAR